MSDKRGENGTPAQGRRRRDWLAQFAPIVFGTALMMMVVAIILSASALHSFSRLEAAEKRQCQRVQRLRFQVNTLSNVVFDGFNYASKQSKNPRYALLADEVNYLRPTDCKAAVQDPDAYTPPNPVPWREYEQARKNVKPYTGKPPQNPPTPTP